MLFEETRSEGAGVEILKEIGDLLVPATVAVCMAAEQSAKTKSAQSGHSKGEVKGDKKGGKHARQPKAKWAASERVQVVNIGDDRFRGSSISYEDNLNHSQVISWQQGRQPQAAPFHIVSTTKYASSRAISIWGC
jgi:hypothetical protein